MLADAKCVCGGAQKLLDRLVQDAPKIVGLPKDRTLREWLQGIEPSKEPGQPAYFAVLEKVRQQGDACPPVSPPVFRPLPLAEAVARLQAARNTLWWAWFGGSSAAQEAKDAVFKAEDDVYWSRRQVTLEEEDKVQDMQKEAAPSKWDTWHTATRAWVPPHVPPAPQPPPARSALKRKRVVTFDDVVATAPRFPTGRILPGFPGKEDLKRPNEGWRGTGEGWRRQGCRPRPRPDTPQ